MYHGKNPPAPSVRRLSIAQRRVLGMVAGAGPSGATYAILEVHGLSAEILASMAQEGLITATTEMVQAGNRMIAVRRIRITAAGRRAIAGSP